MSDRGFLIPPWYESESPDGSIMNVCSIIWGFSLCAATFTAAKAARQSWKGYRRGRLFTAYPIMVWSEWLASVIISVISWLFLKGSIPPSFWFFFVILCLWVVQMHCILQIIINRVSLVMVNKTQARRLRLGVFLIVIVINISVFCIWIPARLQINDTYEHVNDIWDRAEKAIFAVVDAGLNCYFMWTVRTGLISAGLVKYQPLFRFNLMMAGISVALDLVLIGSMSIGTGVIYIQFHPLVYLIKLHIELNMAELIAKAVRASNPMNTQDDTFRTQEPSTERSDTPHTQPRRDSGVASTHMSKKIDLAAQGISLSGIDYHEALRPVTSAHRSIIATDTTLDVIDNERGEAASTNELTMKISAV